MSRSTEYKLFHASCFRIKIEQGILNIGKEIDRILEGLVLDVNGFLKIEY
jgi:hypothetical protein